MFESIICSQYFWYMINRLFKAAAITFNFKGNQNQMLISYTKLLINEKNGWIAAQPTISNQSIEEDKKDQNNCERNSSDSEKENIIINLRFYEQKIDQQCYKMPVSFKWLEKMKKILKYKFDKRAL